MINAIQNGKDAEDVRNRCRIAEEWLKANEIIDNETYNLMMITVSSLHRESYHIA